MSEPAGIRRRPLVVGANHRTSSLGLRDRLFVEDALVPTFLAGLRERGIDQALVLSTCDRVEVQSVDNGEGSAEIILSALARHGGVALEELRTQSYTLSDAHAVDHVFRVAASLDSLVIGEPQVLGQLKAAHRLARDAGMTGAELEALVQAAFNVAKQVRTDTAVGEGPVSIAAVAVQVAGDLHGDLSERRALLIGAGEMGQLVGEHMLAAGLGYLAVTHPIEARADPLARALDCHRVTFDALAEQMAEADIVLAALGRREPVLAADMIHAALRKRRYRPVFVVDLAVPGDVDPAVNRIDDAFLYDIQDLERLATESHAKRQSEAEAGRRIVADAVAGFMAGRAARAAVPAVTQFRAWAEGLRKQALVEASGDAEKATRLLLGRLLHDPSVAMKKAAQDDGGELILLEQALRRLFALEPDLEDEKDDAK
ncbi:MAG: glutamyl-tRNA reductase [Rhodospirillaceae bacterium]|nr:glutamyl-tRNA reductase [Rhodospirillaceae bacterium]